ncbi:hypothetical protein M433DRAFT_9170, partial [Acidomyces richmondensis BFW]
MAAGFGREIFPFPAMALVLVVGMLPRFPPLVLGETGLLGDAALARTGTGLGRGGERVGGEGQDRVREETNGSGDGIVVG